MMGTTIYSSEISEMFPPSHHKIFATPGYNAVDPHDLVLGVFLNGEAKAYPIKIIGYHHELPDTVGGMPVVVTYCIECRSGRVYDPIVNGKNKTFRLVGGDETNAMFEDDAGSWWHQENGEAFKGPETGTSLDAIPSEQMTLQAWLRLHPQSLILQKDPDFVKKYTMLDGYDRGKTKNNEDLSADPGSWQRKSWIVGIFAGGNAKAYDWNDLKNARVINDTLGTAPDVIMLEEDTMSFHAFSRTIDNTILTFSWDSRRNTLTDTNTHSVWNTGGVCIEGALKGTQLASYPAYQEYWFAWKQFHPNTTVFTKK